MAKPATGIPVVSEKKINYFQAAKDYYNKKKKKYFNKKKIKINEKGLLGAVEKRNQALKDAADF